MLSTKNRMSRPLPVAGSLSSRKYSAMVRPVSATRKIERFFSQPFHVAEVFTGSPGKYVTLKETIRGFKMICDGECDHLPEQAFYMVGGIEEAFDKAKKMTEKKAA